MGGRTGNPPAFRALPGPVPAIDRPRHRPLPVRTMKKAFLPVALLALALCGCGSGQKEELQGRPLVYQLGMKISTAANAQTLDEVQATLSTAKLSAGSREHLVKAIDAQRKLLDGAAEMQLNERMDGAKKVLAEVEAASAAVE